jgi:hypothetical protein
MLFNYFNHETKEYTNLLIFKLKDPPFLTFFNK